MNPRIIRFPQSATSTATLCQVCGSLKGSEGLCLRCNLRLVDLALSDNLDEFPRLAGKAVGEQSTVPAIAEAVYDHFEIARLPSGHPWELGRGAMGITYKALDTHLGCAVALKVINARSVIGPGGRQRMLREARAAAQLRHPNIANVYHLGLDEENCYYAMEFIEGETLEARVRREGALPHATALNIAEQVVRGLQMAHQKGFIHRDIKPTNIMLVDTEMAGDGQEVVKLIDFGLVKMVVGSDRDDPFCQNYFAGTPLYASPEQLDDGITDARSDIYSVGLVLWYMLTGQPPVALSGPQWEPGHQRMLSPQAETALEQMPKSIADLLRGMTAVDPAARPQAATELLGRIRLCSDGIRAQEAIKIGIGEHDTRPWRISRRNGWRLGAWICMLVALGLFAVHARKHLAMAKDLERTVSSPANPASLVEARVLYEKGNDRMREHTKVGVQNAIALYTQAIARNPALADAHAGLAVAYYQQVARFGASPDLLDAAVTSAQRAIATDPKASNGFRALAAVRSLQRRPWEALTQLHRALEIDPQSPQSMCDFSLLWCSVGRPQFGLPWALAAAKMVPAEVMGWHAAAESGVDLCDDAEAEKCYQNCLALKPTWVSAHCGLAHLYMLQGDFARARQGVATAESLEANLSLPPTLKAQIALCSGQYAEAEEIYRRLLTMNRSGMINYYGAISYLSALGFLRYQAGDLQEGNMFLEEAAKSHEADSDGPQGVYDLAAIRAIQGRRNDALSLLKRAIDSGWMDYRSTRLDPRFSSIRGEATFGTMLDGLSIHVTQMRQEAENLCRRAVSISDYPVQATPK